MHAAMAHVDRLEGAASTLSETADHRAHGSKFHARLKVLLVDWSNKAKTAPARPASILGQPLDQKLL